MKTKPKPKLEHYVLFTNLEYVLVNKVRTNTHALLLEERDDDLFGDVRRQARGFGTCASWPTFDIELPSIRYTLRPGSGGPVVLSEHKPPRSLFNGGRLQIKAGPTLDLITCDYEAPINVSTFEGARDDRTILRIWEELPKLVASFWRAPNMPRLAWGPP